MAARALPFTAGMAPEGKLRESIIRFGEMSEAIPDANEVTPKARIVARGMDGMAMGLERDTMLNEIWSKRRGTGYLHYVLRVELRCIKYLLHTW